MDDQLNIGIIAYSIFRGGGLMHFLFQAIKALSQSRPNWNFYVIGSISLSELKHYESNNVHIQFWDDDPSTIWIDRIGNRTLGWIGKGEDAGFLLQKRAEQFGIPWGKITKRQALIKNMDVLWVPHYNISLEQLDLLNEILNVQVPVLFTVHDIHPAFYPDDHPSGDLVRFYHGFVPFAQKAQRIMTHSQFQKKAICGQLIIPEDNISVTPQPPLIDPKILTIANNFGDSSEVLKHYAINRPFVFYPASTTHIHKNHARLFAAWSQLKNELGSTCPLLVCTGKGNRIQYKRLLSLIHSFHLENDVIFTGPIDMFSLAILFQNCRLVIIPTLYEGAGSGILTDALIVGKPIACADIPQIREQLNALGSISITFFDPHQVPAMTQSVMNILNDLENQTNLALKNQISVQQNFKEMWNKWSEDYARNIEEIYVSTKFHE